MTKIFEPEWGNPSLRTIIEAELPEPVSLIPATPSWWILLIAFIGLLCRLLWSWRRRYLRESYRRDALRQLRSIRERLATEREAVARELAPLLRATAIAAVNRDTISGLEGDAYAAALAELAPSHERLPVDKIHRLAYAPLDTIDAEGIETLIAKLERWIKQHRRPHA